jgi:hypothetical protein
MSITKKRRKSAKRLSLDNLRWHMHCFECKRNTPAEGPEHARLLARFHRFVEGHARAYDMLGAGLSVDNALRRSNGEKV